MNTTILTILLVLLCISGVGGIFLINYHIKKWWGWAFSLVGFLCGLSIGLLGLDLIGGLKLGSIFAFMIIFGGVITRKQRLHAEEISKDS